MKILIVAGGTGSIALQTGLYTFIDKQFDGVETKVLVNAYDNGLSTGAVRRVMGGRILGPSDVRKNQTTRLKLENPESPWHKFLDIRFTVESSKAKQFCLDQVAALNKCVIPLMDAINAYFATPIATKIDYTDFSLANIVYAGFAVMNGNSLRKAASIMADMMGLKDNVILNDDTSLFLGAVTKSGLHITDEGDIVSWGNEKDPFVDVFFFDHNGQVAKPVLCDEAKNAIEEANLIILSTGTQWSSLIPTYATVGFKEALSNSNAKVIMVMNRQADKDAPGQTGADIINAIVPRYIEEGRISLIVDKTGDPALNEVNESISALVENNVIASVASFDLKDEDSKKDTVHRPMKLAWAVIVTYFQKYLNSEHFMFDYDDTLVGRGNSFPAASAFNKKAIVSGNDFHSMSICTGNSIKAVTLGTANVHHDILTGQPIKVEKTLTVFADGGVNKYDYALNVDSNGEVVKPKLVECVDPSVKFPLTGEMLFSVENIIRLLNQNGIPPNKIENRGSIAISIKPIDEEYRPAILSLVQRLVPQGLNVQATGRTTIDITHPRVSKAAAVKHVLDSGVKSITFVGDEFANGNDAPVHAMNDPRVKCLAVSSPAETALFLTAMRFTPLH